MITDQAISDEIKKIRQEAKTHLLLTMVTVGTVITVLVWFFTTRNSSPSSQYEKEIKILKSELVSIRENYSRDSIKSVEMKNHIDSLNTQRASDVKEIAGFRNKLISISNEYKKIPDYRNVSGDSLASEFARRFN